MTGEREIDHRLEDGLLRLDNLHVRMHHLPARAALPGFARHEQCLAAAVFISQERLIEPQGPQVAGALPQEDPQYRAACLTAAQLDLFHRAQHADQRAFLQLIDAAQVGEILIVARKKEDQVADRGNTQSSQ